MVLWHAITVSQHVVMTIPLYDIAFQHCIFLSDTILSNKNLQNGFMSNYPTSSVQHSLKSKLMKIPCGRNFTIFDHQKNLIVCNQNGEGIYIFQMIKKLWIH